MVRPGSGSIQKNNLEQVRDLYWQPLLDLVLQAAQVHRNKKNPGVQLATLLSLKTGRCVEDCAYCAQSARYKTSIEKHDLLDKETVLAAARKAREAGASRFCMGAAYREVKDGPEFDQVLEYVKEVADLGLEVCCTLGMLNHSQAARLKQAGLHAYNHNLDTSEDFYPEIISTRTYEERLATLDVLEKNQVHVCSGAIIGMGESHDDRVKLLFNLANRPVEPESVPINALVSIEGTPLADQPPVTSWQVIRMVATARVLMPGARVRLSAGREMLNDEAQALCFLAGANSIFLGDKLLTASNNDAGEDLSLLRELGLKAQ